VIPTLSSTYYLVTASVLRVGVAKLVILWLFIDKLAAGAVISSNVTVF